MFRTLIGCIFLLTTISTASAQEIKKGDTVISNGLLQLSIRNAENLAPTWKYGASCWAQDGRSMTAIGVDGDRVLVLYKDDDAPNNITWCPSGTISFITRGEWIAAAKATEKLRADQALIEKDRAIVEKLLKEYLKK